MISSLPHFIALLCRPTATAIPDDTILIVVDSLPSLINHAYPRAPDYRCRSKAKQGLTRFRAKLRRTMLTDTYRVVSEKSPGPSVHRWVAAKACGNARRCNCFSYTMRNEDAGRARSDAGPSN